MQLDAAQKVKFKKNIREVVDALARVQGENELINEIAKQAKDDFDIKPAKFKKVAKIIFEQSLDEQRVDFEELCELVETVIH
jgi:hypothetical protein